MRVHSNHPRRSSELFEITPEQLKSNAGLLWQLVEPEDFEQLAKAIQTSAKDLTPFVQEFRLNVPNRPVRWMMANSQPSQLSSGDVLWDGIIFDITYRKMAELQLQLANDKLAKSTKKRRYFSHNEP